MDNESNEIKAEAVAEETTEETTEGGSGEGQEAGALDLIREYVSGEEFRGILAGIVRQVLQEEQGAQEPEPEPEDAVKAERERVSALLDNSEVIDSATLRDYVAQGRTVADLAMHVLATKKEEIAKSRASIIAKCESETPVQCVSDSREETTHENNKANVRSLLVNLGLR